MPARRVLTGALVAGALLACSEGTAPRAPKSAADLSQADANVEAVSQGRNVFVMQWIRPLHTDVTASATIGAAGGVIRLPSIGAVFTVPRNALATATTITITANRGKHVVFTGGPSGTQFAVPATITLSLANTNVYKKRSYANMLLGAYITSANQIGNHHTVVDTEDNPAQNNRAMTSVNIPVPHFSVVILASQRVPPGPAAQ